MRHSFEEKLNIISKIKGGYPLSTLCRDRNLSHENVRKWLLRYDKYGEEGLRQPTEGYHFTPEEKERIVFEHTEKGVSLQQLSLDYDVSLSAVKRWVRTVRSGVSLYSVKRRGRPPKNTMARPKKKEPQTELEKLQAENLRLRAENALLKKVKALVEEQKARERLSGQEPSAD
jgi:transposase